MDKRYEHGEIEKEIQLLWEELLPYAFDPKSSKRVYSIDTPPPTVSGSLHIGHIFSYTQTDLVARYKRMRGYNVFYPMGFDDNGLPTERFVEKKHKIQGHMLKRSEFVKLCLQESQEMAVVFSQLWKKIGLSVDWTKLYSTISDQSRKISQHSFIELYNKGLVYKKEEPALFCTTCRTTVAQAELDDAEISSSFNDIYFTGPHGEKLVVATTRPELLPACVALFFHPDDARYSALKGKKATSPVFGKEISILADDAVVKEKGTGLVMCCTFGDQTDVMWYKKHKLPFIQVVGRDGRWTEVSGPLAGLKVHDARKKVLELLAESGALGEQKPVTHMVNVHERCKHEIEYLILNQWFVKILDNKQKFLELADQIEWKPEFMKARYKDWVEHLGWDWCISRQRFYGVPFPVWICQDCNEIILADVKTLPVDPQEQQCSCVCPKCSNKNLVGESDVMDTWNTSSLTPQINLNWPEGKELSLPMSLRPQAHDIIRTWAFYTIVKAYYHQNAIPWKEIAVSGYVVAKGKEKISKSKGNAPTDPEQLLNTYPADAIRYWAANGRLGVDTPFSETQFAIGNKLLTKLWNAFRFCKDHTEAYEKGERPELDDLNKWVLFHFSKTVEQYVKNFEASEYTASLEAIERFFWQIFCDNYLELVKDRIFNPGNYSPEIIKATQYTFYEIGYGILQLFAPFIPHATEKLFQLFYAQKEGIKSIHISQLDERRFTYNFATEADTVDKMVAVVGEVRKLKSENKLSLKAEIEQLKLYVVASELEKAKSQEMTIKGVIHAKSIVYEIGSLDASKLTQDGEILHAEVAW